MSVNAFIDSMFSLKGKTAIVTGGNSGLGKTFSRALAKAGANVFIASVLDDNLETCKELEKNGVKSGFLKIDITKNGAAKQVVEKTLETFSQVDILVNNAGICLLADVLEFDRTKWDPMLSVNLTAAFEMTHEVSKHMVKQNSGKIINICSMFSYLGGQQSVAYAATKHGIAGLTKAYCDELARFNIQVNGIAPGYYATDITAETRADPQLNASVLKHIPAGRWGEFDDLMGSLVFLSSKASDYVNGHIISVDGGYLVR